MGNRRRTTLIVATILALLVSVLPILISFHLSDLRAAQAERDYLSQYAHWTLQRAQKNLSEASATLTAIEREGWMDCSPEHIRRMRDLANEASSVESLTFIENGHLVCNSWGPVQGRPVFPAPVKWVGEKLGVTLNDADAVGTSNGTLSVTLGRHSALVKSERLVDVLRERSMTLGVALPQGPVVALSGTLEPYLAKVLATGDANGVDQEHIFATATADGLVAFAVSERSVIKDRIQHELLVLVPIGLLMSGVLVGLVFWVSRQRLSFPAEIALGIKQGEFVPFYQPIVSLQTGRCVGGEALVRWQRPDGAVVSPNAFIPAAESAGLIAALTDHVIECVVRDIKKMLVVQDDFHIAINISAQDIESGRFLPVLSAAVARHGIEASHVWLEATERGFINASVARETLCRARELGHAIAIDDFGTGYSSLSLLEQLPLDALKIDKSFVDSIGKQAATSVVTSHIVGMAQELSLTIVAEGVETREQEAYLRAAGVQCGQGWLYAHAMPLQEFLAYLDHDKASATDVSVSG